jgi:hypothetical protein
MRYVPEGSQRTPERTIRFISQKTQALAICKKAKIWPVPLNHHTLHGEAAIPHRVAPRTAGSGNLVPGEGDADLLGRSY